jgi:hypothetical protein
MLRYRPPSGAAEEAAGWAPFVREVLLRPGGATAAAPRCAPLSGAHVFVCAHARRDKRCGVCGPALVDALRAEAAAAAAAPASSAPVPPVAVYPCSHVGGHAYAGNVLVFDRAAGVPRGNWFGYVTPDDVPSLLKAYIGGGAPPDARLWRGAMGMSPDACVEAAKDLRAACGDAGAGCGVRGVRASLCGCSATTQLTHARLPRRAATRRERTQPRGSDALLSAASCV